MESGWSRRRFLRRMAAGAAALTLPPGWWSAQAAGGEVLPMRRFGRAEVQVSALCVGGAHVSSHMAEREAARFLERAVEVGCRFFDTAESYSGGESERLFGRYLPRGRRKELFLMTKTRAMDRRTAERHLAESLERMRTDYLDLWQMHDITSAADVDRRIENGVLEFMLEAKAAGTVRYLGFTGHTRPSAHRHMLERLRRLGVELDATQMPINIVDPHY
ncbi:MAG: aldo/keto reductase, partial [Verrucomicrobiia bacterium]